MCYKYQLNYTNLQKNRKKGCKVPQAVLLFNLQYLQVGVFLMLDDENFDSDLRVRITKQELETFKTKAKIVTGKPYQIFLREIVAAFNEGRLRIIPTEQQRKQLGDLYQ